MNEKLKEITDYFVPNKVYTRKIIHDKFGGNSQSGFSVSKDYPVIFVFTSEQGREYGYIDGWMGDGFLHIAGEGQEGDMEFTRGNRAILNHKKEGKSLLYFESLGGDKRKYCGEITLFDYYSKELLDRNQHTRKGIVFRFQSVDAPVVDSEQAVFENRIHAEGAEKRVVMTQKERNPALRAEAIRKYGSKCMACGFNFDEFYGKELGRGYIEVHHEKMLADVEGERNVTVEDVKVLCSNCHRIVHSKRKMLDWRLLKEGLQQSD